MQDSESTAEVPQALFKKRNAKSKATTRRREPTPPPDSDSASGFTSSEDESGRAVKRRRKNGGLTASSKSNRPERTILEPEPAPVASISRSTADDATKRSNWYDEQLDKRSDQNLPQPENSAPDGNYRGIANYSSFLQKNPDRIKQVGPVKQSTNVRTITLTDYAPDVCKDYKQTGFCGFGDSCKFLHAREDYKQGWALDRDWEIDTKGKKLTGRTVVSANRDSQQKPEDEDDDKLLEKIPFACIICKKPYKSPVVTKCQHYFCEACALQRYRKDPSCAACATSTGGVFNVAKKLDKLLQRKRERERLKAEEASEVET